MFKIHELWSDLYKAWFDSKDDPSICLIKVDMKRAEYWGHSGGTFGAYIQMAASALTGKKDSGAENEVIEC